MPSGEVSLQVGADILIEYLDIIRTQPAAIRRIHHQHAGLRIVHPFGHVAATQLYHIFDLCRLDVAACGLHCLRVYIASINLESELPFLAVIIIEVFKEIFVEVRPFLKRKTFAIYAGIDVGRDKGCLYQECSRTAHRVSEVAFSAPAGLHDYTRCQGFVDRCLGRVITVAALRQWLAA